MTDTERARRYAETLRMSTGLGPEYAAGAVMAVADSEHADLRATVARLEELAEGWESEADDNEDQHRQGPAIARAVRACARDLRDVLAGHGPAATT